MCGISGVASTIPQTDRAWLGDCSQQMAHRGPDGMGEWWSSDGRLGFAHRRLAIVDLSAAGHQPMHLAGRGLSIVFNGEIYNYRDVRSELEQRGYRFHSQSDTEVILAAYAEWSTDAPRGKLVGHGDNGPFRAAALQIRKVEGYLGRTWESWILFHALSLPAEVSDAATATISYAG